MKLVLRVSLLWLLLAVLIWLFASTEQDVLTLPLAFGGTHLHGGFGSWITIGVAMTLIPAFCMWLTITAEPLLPQRWPGRLLFWLGTVAGWFVVAVMMQGRAELGSAERAAVLFGAGVTVLTAAWLLFKLRPFPGWRLLGEITIVAVGWAAICGAIFLFDEAKTRELRKRGEARWTEIGLPMAEFEKTLVAGRENAGSEVLRQILREQVGMRYYKTGTRLGAAEPAIEPSEETKAFLKNAVQVLSAPLPPADDVDLSLQPVAAIQPLGARLDEDYRRILAAEPPTWASDPHEGFAISVPNFLAIRQFAQLIGADANRRLSEGDQDGAARALAAGQRMNATLRQNPTLVSLMIHVAVEALLAAKQVRLPAEEGALPAIAHDAVEMRAEFLRRVQLESWVALRFVEETGEPEVAGNSLPRWLARIKGRAWRRHEMAMAALNGAEHAAIHQDPATLSLPDLGVGRHEAVSEAYPTVMEFNVSRAMMRLTATLLLREQVELIRLARASLATGAPLRPYQSVAVPSAHWEVTIDREKATASTRLVSIPEWVAKNEVTPGEFWSLPLDGSGTWQFHRPGQAAAAH